MNHIVKTIAISIAAGCAFLASPVTAGIIAHDTPIVNQERIGSKPSFTIDVQQSGVTEAVKLLIEKTDNKRVYIRLTDPDGYPLESFTTNKKSVKVERSYSFFGAAEGTYTFEISDGKDKVTKKIKLERSPAKVTTQIVLN